MDLKLLTLVTLGVIVIFISSSEAGVCKKTCYKQVSNQRCRSGFWRRRSRCSIYYTQGKSTCNVCCNGYTGSKCTTDINECSSSSTCQHVCSNTYGSYRCSCRSGYLLNSDRRTCRDINECASSSSNRCQHTCLNTAGSYKCSCRAGYKLHSNGASCIDIDECALKTHACSQNCINIAGSYRCSCNTGFTVVTARAPTISTKCEGKYSYSKCSKKISVKETKKCGFFGWSRCYASTSYKTGYATCKGCASGYTDLTNLCSKATCTGSSACQNGGTCIGPNTCACRPGYSLPNCINPCANNRCGHICVPGTNSYTCRCNSGYNLASDGRTCHASNPCAQDKGGCSHYCQVMAPGRYTCLCPTGYTLQYDRKTCKDNDECYNNPCDHRCTNTPGSYTCSCSQGYASSRNGAICNVTNVNELSAFFLFTDTYLKGVYKMSFTASSYTKIPYTGMSNPIAIDFDPRTGLVFWTDVGIKRIYSGTLDGSVQKTVKRLSFYSIPDGLAVDPSRRKVFYTDTGLDIIASMDYTGANHRVIINTGLAEPRAIVLDTQTQTIYWTDWGPTPKIERCNYDGSNRMTIVSGGLRWTNGLVLDKKASRLYWADAYTKKIESSDLSGNNRTVVYKTAYGHYYDIVALGHKLYYSDWRRNVLRSVQKDGRNPGNFGPAGFIRVNGLYLYDDGRHDGTPPVNNDPKVCQTGEICADFDDEGSVQSSLVGVTQLVSTTVGTAHRCSRQAVFKINFTKMSPPSDALCHAGTYNSQQMLKIDLFLYNGSRTGWQFNIGDSKSNNGYAGDSGHSDFAAEIQGLGNTITTYASTFEDTRTPADCTAQSMWSDAVMGSTVNHVTFYIANNFFLMINDVGQTAKMCHKCLFGLDGRDDRRAGGTADTDIYVAINRVVGSSSRSGYGTCSLKMKWVDGPPSTGNTEPDDENGSGDSDSGSGSTGEEGSGSGSGSGNGENSGSGSSTGNEDENGSGSSSGNGENSGSGSSSGNGENSGSGSSSGNGENSGSGSSSGNEGDSGSGSSSGNGGDSGSESSSGNGENSGSGSSSGNGEDSGSGSSSGNGGDSGSESSSGNGENSGSGSSSGNGEDSGSGSSSGNGENSGSGSSSGNGEENGYGSSSGNGENSGSGSSSGNGENSGSGSSSGNEDENGSGSSSGNGENSGSGSGSGNGENSGSGSGSSGNGENIGSGSGSGNGENSGSGSGSGNGENSGSGSGSGNGENIGSGSGPGNGENSGSGSGSGNGENIGSGSGSGNGENSGSGSGSGNGENIGSGSGSGNGENSGSGSGSGNGENSGSGSGTGNGENSGSGSGSGNGENSGSGSGSENGENSGSGSGSGNGENSGSGSGSGNGENSGSGSGSGNGENSGSGSSSGNGENSGSGSGSENGENSGSGSTSGNGENSGSGSGSGNGENSGSGSGSGNGENSGSGSGSENGENSGSGSTSGNGENSGSGSGSGNGENSGSGSGSGNGENSGSGSGSGNGENSGSGSGSGNGENSGSGSSSGNGENSGSGSGSGNGGDSGSESSSGNGENSGSGSSSGNGENSGSGSGSGNGENSGSGSGSGNGENSGSGSGSGNGENSGPGSSSGNGENSGSESGSGNGENSGSGSGSGNGENSGSGSGSGNGGDSGSGSSSGNGGDSGSGSSSGNGENSGSGSGTGNGENSGSGSGTGNGEDSGSGSSSGNGGDGGSGSSSGNGENSGSGSSTGNGENSGSGSSSGNGGDSGSGSSSGNGEDSGSGSSSGNEGDIGSGSSSGNEGDSGSGSSSGNGGDSGSGSSSGNGGDSGSGSSSGNEDENGSGSSTGNEDESGSTVYVGCYDLTNCSKALVGSYLELPNSDCENFCRCMVTTVQSVKRYQWVESTCGEGHVWNADQRHCDNDGNYQCPAVTLDGTGSTDPKCVGTCSGPSDLNKLTNRNNTECNQFCQCVKDTANTYYWQPLHCEHGSIWANAQQLCVAQYQMNCLANGTGIHDPTDNVEDWDEYDDDDEEAGRCPVESCGQTQDADLTLLPYSGCAKFCQCAPKETLANGTVTYYWVVQTCAFGAFWNHATRQCGSTNATACLVPPSNIEEEDDVPRPPWQGPTVFNCSGVCSDEFHGDMTSELESNCTRYCHCAPKTNSPTYEWIPMFCAPGTLFDSARKRCDHEDDVQCLDNGVGVGIGEEEDESEGTDNDMCPFGGCNSIQSGSVTLVDGSSCRTYCKCMPFSADSALALEYKWITYECPEGEAFNTTSGQCEISTSSLCPETATTQPDGKCDASCSQDKWGNLTTTKDGDCSAFCQCTPLNNDPSFYWQTLHCGTNTRFSLEAGTCVHENEVDCPGFSSGGVEGICPVDECKYVQNQNLLVLPGSDCRKFCQCSPLTTYLNGTVEYTWVVKDCAPGTRWNPVTGNCGHFDANTYVCPDEGSTGEGDGEGDNGLNDGCPVTCASGDRDNFKAAVDTTCRSYCQCAPARKGGYYWQKMYCAPGTLFDNENTVCLFDDEVECSTVPNR